jgi:hypothetical protein
VAGHNTRGWLNYVPSLTVQYGSIVALKADDVTASNNQSSLTSFPSTYDFWPAHRSNLRYVRGVDTGSPQFKDSCIALSATGALFTLGANFSDGEDNTYQVNGLHSETFSIRNLK